MRNAALSAIVGGISDTVAALCLLPSGSRTTQTSSLAVSAAVQSSEESSGGQQSVPEGVEGAEGKNYRMDIQDFIE